MMALRRGREERRFKGRVGAEEAPKKQQKKESNKVDNGEGGYLILEDGGKSWSFPFDLEIVIPNF
ncbi:hypothetical protein TSUD_26620 [Trifolium subterraneum]|uniref:Uncharacterized protein n=1 Tax=Trifolium subterraneum TaxID=3900 RepID=A0A2Z6NWT9_TRISU|nr:hypothetical protein TSUD_26620 [Trifolium subterraneum]